MPLKALDVKTGYVPTKSLLVQFAPALEKYADILIAEMPKVSIDTRIEVRHFLSQCAIESNQFKVVEENLNYSAQGLANTWPKRYSVNPAATTKTPNELAKRLGRNPQAIANNVYANRMGNGDEASGDGWKHRGLGLKQVTGKDNQRNYSYWRYKDDRVIKDPILYLTKPLDAVVSACWFWDANSCSDFAMRNDIVGLTRVINGGTNGLDDGIRNNLNDRVDWFNRATVIFV